MVLYTTVQEKKARADAIAGEGYVLGLLANLPGQLEEELLQVFDDMPIVCKFGIQGHEDRHAKIWKAFVEADPEVTVAAALARIVSILPSLDLPVQAKHGAIKALASLCLGHGHYQCKYIYSALFGTVGKAAVALPVLLTLWAEQEGMRADILRLLVGATTTGNGTNRKEARANLRGFPDRLAALEGEVQGTPLAEALAAITAAVLLRGAGNGGKSWVEECVLRILP